MSLQFDFDPAKSASNKLKHGLDFVEAQALWLGKRIEFPADRVSGEIRYAVIGTIKGIHHVAIITYRGSIVRIISARRATPKEGAYYDQQIKNT